MSTTQNYNKNLLKNLKNKIKYQSDVNLKLTWKELQQNNINLKQAHILLQKELDTLKSKAEPDHKDRLEEAEKELANLKQENERLKTELIKVLVHFHLIFIESSGGRC